ncbi:MAG: riboflavin synthase [Deltaproteobacteria bacterium]|nr:riboflavin synthase [Deltaproteobacteria bacterium]
MFTGLVEDAGTLAAVRPLGSGVVLEIRTGLPLGEVKIGDSIAVNGACLTVESVGADRFSVTAARETVEHTTLGGLRPGAALHLERAMRLGGRLDGHLVQGHVDGVGRVQRSTIERESVVLWVEVPRDLERYVAAKGSICLDGVSLTVNEVRGSAIRVNLIPHTGAVTHLAALRAGDRLNVEVDVLARYLERLFGADARRGDVTMDALARGGYLR